IRECHLGRSSFKKRSRFSTAVGSVHSIKERKMRASRTIITITAVVITLFGCGTGKDQQAPANALSLGLPGLIAPPRQANWTLGGVPCTLIPVPAAAPLGTGTCPG